MTYPNSLDHMLAAWNESDPSMVRSHLERALASGQEHSDAEAWIRSRNS